MAKMGKIKIGKAAPSASFVAAVRDAGYEFGRNENGETEITVNFPGVSPVELTQDQLGCLVEVIGRTTPQGSDPAAVFERSATEDPAGNLSARFSDEKRSRSVSIPSEERGKLTELLSDLYSNWSEYTAELEEAEAAAAAKNDGE